jgi:hypothetical protein
MGLVMRNTKPDCDLPMPASLPNRGDNREKQGSGRLNVRYNFNKYIGTHQAEQDMHGALGWITRGIHGE